MVQIPQALAELLREFEQGSRRREAEAAKAAPAQHKLTTEHF